ncbi:hypothetical protein [Ornithinimicrobium cavernae]|uniref:hypothetical protein n=1 Tax=Ornithinimicrobium cavernae TaxID=2666047 RepID=UPI0012B17309|nr:hypothetical protein [Ornithinimicrobium cavernae]
MPEETGGQVEREARQLVEAAARWLSAVPDDTEYAARSRRSAAAAEESVPEESLPEESQAGERAAAEPRPGESVAGESVAGESVAGESVAGEDHVCRGCPWCRAKAAAGPLGADTIDSIAHLLSAAAESLSLFAQSRRDAAQGPHSDDGTDDVEVPGPDRGSPADDALIDWDDEDEDECEERHGPTADPRRTGPTRTQQRPAGPPRTQDTPTGSTPARERATG